MVIGADARGHETVEQKLDEACQMQIADFSHPPPTASSPSIVVRSLVNRLGNVPSTTEAPLVIKVSPIESQVIPTNQESPDGHQAADAHSLNRSLLCTAVRLVPPT